MANCAVFKVRPRGRPQAEWLFRPGPQKGSDAEKPGPRPVSQNSTACVRRLRAFRTGSVDMLETQAGQKADMRGPVKGTP